MDYLVLAKKIFVTNYYVLLVIVNAGYAALRDTVADKYRYERPSLLPENMLIKVISR